MPHSFVGPEDGLSSTTLCLNVGITFRQLDHWCRAGWVPGIPAQNSPGSGTYRRFGPAQAERVRLLATASAIQSMPINDLADRLACSRDLFQAVS